MRQGQQAGAPCLKASEWQASAGGEVASGQPSFARQRARLVEQLRAAGIRNEAVLAAMAEIPRHEFVDPALVYQAYDDVALPIGHRQTISQPCVVARMLELLLAPDVPRKVLEVGVGSGYQTALLARLVPEVYGLERIRALLTAAQERLRPYRLANVRLKWADATQGLPEAAPFDAIIAAAAGERVPEAWREQLVEGGRIVAPLAEPSGQQQWLSVGTKRGPLIRWERVEPVRFVPLLAGTE